MGHFGRAPIRRAWFVARLPGADPQLPGPGRADPRRPDGDRQPVLPAVPALGADPDGRARDGRDGDRLAGGDLRRVLGHPPGGAARLPAAADDPPHLDAARSARSTCPPSTGASSPRSSRSWSASAPRPTLASAYGIAVTGTLAIDTILFFVVVRMLWHKPLWLVVAGAAAFLIVDLAFFAANLTKVLHGGWFPLAIAAVVFIVLTTWQRGREIVTREPHRGGGPAARRSSTSCATCDPPVYRVARHRRVPQRQPGDDAAGAARQRRAQPRAARERRDRVDRDAAACPHVPDAERRDRSTTSATATTASPTSRRASASRTRSTCRARCAGGRPASRARSTSTARPTSSRGSRSCRPGRRGWRVAQEAVPRDRAQRRQPGRVLRAARRPHGRDGLAHRALSAAGSDADGSRPARARRGGRRCPPPRTPRAAPRRPA